MRHPTRIRKLKGFIKLPEQPNPSRSDVEKNLAINNGLLRNFSESNFLAA